MQDKIRIGITIGNYNGIGPELIVRTFNDNRLLKDIVPVIYGSKKIIDYYKNLTSSHELRIHEANGIDDFNENKVNLINCVALDEDIQPGVLSEKAGIASYESLKKCTDDLANNVIDAMVTSPISKNLIQKAGFSFAGHTEYLANLSGEKEALMILCTNDIRVSLVTGHVPITDVSKLLTVERMTEKLEILEKSLIRDFNILKPKIAVLGLNPHAGENGKIGKEEIEIIIPVIKNATNNGKLVFGPFPSDSFFGSNNLKNFDAILAIYHDQGLTGFKTLCFDEGVNYTAGLPIVRTSPDHGTAFDIAGKNIASLNSFRNAVFKALDIYKNRTQHKEMHKIDN